MSAEAWSTLLRPGTDLAELWGELTAEGPSLGAMDRLAKRHGRELARFVSLQMELGRRAAQRFPDGRLTFFTAKGLEQASGAAAADERAERFARAARLAQRPDTNGAHGAGPAGGSPGEGPLGDPPLVWDACSGIGADAAALGMAGLRVFATDLDPESARCTAGNLRLGQRGAGTTEDGAVAIADATHGPPVQAGPGPILALFDPDRRRDGVRSLRPGDWAPSLDATLHQCSQLDGGCVKLAPGLDVQDLGITQIDGSRLSWISVDGELKEIDLWLGSLGADLDGGAQDRLAVRRNRSGDRTEHSGPAGYADEMDERAPGDGDWLVELDVALWQSDLAPGFAAERGLGVLELGLKGGFLVAGSPPESHGMARAWRILAQAPADSKRVRAMLRAHAVGSLTVKTRGIREPAETLAAKFGAKPGVRASEGTHPGLLAVAPINGKRTALLLEAAE